MIGTWGGGSNATSPQMAGLQARPTTAIARELELACAQRRHAVLEPNGATEIFHAALVEELAVSTPAKSQLGLSAVSFKLYSPKARLELSKLVEIWHGPKAAAAGKEVHDDPAFNVRKHAHDTAAPVQRQLKSPRSQHSCTHSLMCRLHSPCSPSLQQSPARQTSLPQNRHSAG